MYYVDKNYIENNIYIENKYRKQKNTTQTKLENKI